MSAAYRSNKSGIAEKTLMYCTLMFLISWTPGVIIAMVKTMPAFVRALPERFHENPLDALSTCACLALLDVWPVMHFLGYFRRKRTCAAIAAFTHCVFASLVFFVGWKTFPHSHSRHSWLTDGIVSSVYGGWHLSTGYLLTRLRVTEKLAAVYIYFSIMILVILALCYTMSH